MSYLEGVSCFLVAASLAALSLGMPIKEEHVKRNPNATSPGNPRDGTYGIDISSYVSQNTFECLKGDGFNFAIIRAYESDGHPDPNAPGNIANARAAGIEYVDVYMFPCPTCGSSGGEQVEAMIKSLSGSDYGQIWLDIEGPQYWHSSTTENQAFFKELLVGAELHVKRTGVYTSSSQWGPIMGSEYRGGSSHQLWYAHYDDSPSFNDFSPFGGWNKPAIKQYVGDASVCGSNVDKDWYP